MTERIRIAQIVTRFIAGAGTVALHGALQLDPDRYEVTILSGEGGRLARAATDAGLRYVPLRHMDHDIAPLADLAGLRELGEQLARGRFDLVHTHSAKAGLLGRIAAHRAGVGAIVHTFHGFPFHAFQSRAKHHGLLTLERRLGRVTNRFLAVGASVAADAVRLGIAPAERIVAISSCLDQSVPARTRAAQRAARQAMAVPPGMTVVGTVGRLDYQKAPDVLIEALARLDRADVFSVWVGDGPGRVAAETLARQRGVADRMRFLGNRDDVPALLAGFDIFALPSRYEGLPCAIAEAMTCGVPVIASAVNSVPEMVVPGRTGLLVPAENPAALAAAIGYLADHPDVGARFAASAVAHIGDAFTPAALGRDVTGAYELVLAEAGHRLIPTSASSRVADQVIDLRHGSAAPLPTGRLVRS